MILPSWLVWRGEDDGAQHRAFGNSTRQRIDYRKWLVYCDMLGSLSQVWIKPLMSCAGNARLNIQARQENFLVSGVECSTKIQESEKHPVTATCTAQDVIKDTKFGSRTTVSWAVCWLEFSRMSCWFKWETNCSATTRSKSLETYKEGSKLDDSFCTVFFFPSPFFFSRGLITTVLRGFGTLAEFLPLMVLTKNWKQNIQAV